MTWQIDFSHSHIQFSARHLMITNVRGEFQKFTGTIDFDQNNLGNAQINVEIDASSINTRDAQRDGHLKSPDFLDVGTFPTITFKSKKITLNGTKEGNVVGDLTIRGVTKEVTLHVELLGVQKTPFNTINAGFEAHTKINRKDWGLNWNVALEAGGMLVGEEVSINIELELTQVPETQTAAVAH